MPDELKVNANQWNALSQEDQKKVVKILTGTKLVKDDVRIMADPTVAAHRGIFDDIGVAICKAACTAGQSVAMGACVGVGAPPLVAACEAAALAAGEFCRSHC